jgi:hypothetical protein
MDHQRWLIYIEIKVKLKTKTSKVAQQLSKAYMILRRLQEIIRSKVRAVK